MSRQIDELVSSFRVSLEEALRTFEADVSELERPGVMLKAELRFGGEEYPVRVIAARADREIVAHSVEGDIVMGPWVASVELAGGIELYNGITEGVESMLEGSGG